MVNRPAWIGMVSCAVVLLAACSAPPAPIPTPTPTLPPMRVVADDMGGGPIMGVGLEFTLERNANNCFSARDGKILVVPAASTVEDDEIRVPDLPRMRVGDLVEGGGYTSTIARSSASADLIACAGPGEDPIAYVQFFPSPGTYWVHASPRPNG